MYPLRFIREKIQPELERRGLEVVLVKEPKHAVREDLDGVDVVLLMTEIGAHTLTERLAKLCRQGDKPIRSLSRKKASWSFLPDPSARVAEEVEEVAAYAAAAAIEKVEIEEVEMVQVPEEAKKSGSDPLLEMYDAENATLREENARLRAQIAEMEKRLVAVEREAEIIRAARVLVDAGILAEAEIAKRLLSRPNF